jgi:hypothetical protein
VVAHRLGRALPDDCGDGDPVKGRAIPGTIGATGRVVSGATGTTGWSIFDPNGTTGRAIFGASGGATGLSAGQGRSSRSSAATVTVVDR